MTQEYTILQENPRSRIGAICFSVFSILVMAGMQLYAVRNGADFHWSDAMLYAPALALLIAAIVRSYLLYLISVVLCVCQQVFTTISHILRGDAFVVPEVFETAALFLFILLAIGMAWQAVLFYTGRADLVALTNTTAFFVTVSLGVLFLPYIMRVFFPTIQLDTPVHTSCLAIAYLSFVNGLEPTQRHLIPAAHDDARKAPAGDTPLPPSGAEPNADE